MSTPARTLLALVAAAVCAAGVAPPGGGHTAPAGGARPEAINLTRHSGDDFEPMWSPDGRRIAFYSTRNTAAHPGWEIYTMNADGTDQRNLTQHPAYDAGPAAFSPDGRRLAFASKRTGNLEIFVTALP